MYTVTCFGDTPALLHFMLTLPLTHFVFQIEHLAHDHCEFDNNCTLSINPKLPTNEQEVSEVYLGSHPKPRHLHKGSTILQGARTSNEKKKASTSMQYNRRTPPTRCLKSSSINFLSRDRHELTDTWNAVHSHINDIRPWWGDVAVRWHRDCNRLCGGASRETRIVEE